MEDLIKVIVYSAAVVLWIIYKARQQKKSGMWDRRIPDTPVEIPSPVPEIKPEVLRNTRKPPEKKPEKRAPVPVQATKPTDFVLEQIPSEEKYNTAFLRDLIKADSEQVTEENAEMKANEPAYVFNVRDAIIGAEILKRPSW